MGELILRDYQRACLERALSADRNTLFVAPTGAGKGTIIASLAAALAAQGKRVLIVAHRQEIVIDLSERIIRMGLRCGRILPGFRPDSDASIQVATVQTLSVRGQMPQGDVLLVDEAHHYLADDWRATVERVGSVRLFGFSATPERFDGRALGDIFDDLVTLCTYKDLIGRGLIVPCRVLRPPHGLGIDLAQNPVDAYLQYAKDRTAFAFVRPSITDAHALREAFVSRGVQAEVIEAFTPKTTRRATIAKLRSTKTRVIINYDTMTEGVDVPGVDTVILARNPLRSGVFIQMTGRALRAAPGKHAALLLDLCGASYKHGLPTDDRTYSLSGTPIAFGSGEPRVIERDPRASCVLDLDLVDADESVTPTPNAIEPQPERSRAELKREAFRALQARVKTGQITTGEMTRIFEAQFG